MTIISPSLLSCDFLNIESEMCAFDGAGDFWFHLDIMDGHFVPNLTFGHPVVKQIAKISKHPLDAHFMVSNPQFFIDTFKDYNVHNVTFHIEVCPSPVELIDKAKNYYQSVGLSLRPSTPITAISDDLLAKIDLLLIMTVEPGFSGQKFMEDSYERVEYFNQRKKSLNLNFQIQVDGGVNQQIAKKLIDAGADNLVAGSYTFNVPRSDYIKQVETLRS